MRSNKESVYIGKMIGEIQKHTIIKHCFWTNDGENLDMHGHSSSTVEVTDSHIVTLNRTTTDELNKYVSKDSTFTKWFILHPNGGKIGSDVKETLVVTQKRFPDPVKENNVFMYWCKDPECVGKYNHETDSISDIRDLYAGWATNNVLTFDFGNGTVVSEIVLFNTTVVYPNVVKREGFTFDGWDSKITVMPPWDVTIRAMWTEIVVSKSVEIVFAKKEVEMKEEEIKNIISEYTDEEFEIERIVIDDETGETTVIIRFVDEYKAEKFVEAANDIKDSNNYIKFVRTIIDSSFSPRLFLSTLFLLLLF